MEAYSRKFKEWVKITNEHNHRFTTTHVCVLLFKGLVRPPCLLYLALVPLCLASPCFFVQPCHYPTLFCSTLPCLPYPWPCLKDKSKTPPPLNLNVSLFFIEAVTIAWLLFEYTNTCMYVPHCLLALAELCKNLLPSFPLGPHPSLSTNNVTIVVLFHHCYLCTNRKPNPY
jgi:hypothetical protein